MRSSSATCERLRARLAAVPWRLLHDGPAAGAWNMAVDRALLRAAGEGGPPTLRFYSWVPAAVSLGRFQQPRGGIRWDHARSRGWHAVRRPTGGRAVLHHLELTYSITLPPALAAGASVLDGHHVLKEGLERALGQALGIGSSGLESGQVRDA